MKCELIDMSYLKVRTAFEICFFYLIFYMYLLANSTMHLLVEACLFFERMTSLKLFNERELWLLIVDR